MLRDVILLIVIVLFAVLPFPENTYRATGWFLLPALVPAAVLLLRRRVPFVALGVSLACAVALAFAGVVSPSALLAAAVSCYVVVDRRGRVPGLLTVIGAAVVVFLCNGLALGGDLFDATALQFVLFVLLAGALGDAARSRRDFEAAMTERALRAELSRDEEARRRVAEERVRIARDLHDVVAHQISVISLNAGAASSALDTRPERAREALTTIRRASRTVLSDIGGLMSVLRAEGSSAADLRPQHGLADLDALVDAFRVAGLAIELRRPSEAGEMSPAGDHVAYLAVQEALTNAHKHGAGGAVTVTVARVERSLMLRVANPTTSGVSAPVSGGHGLRGLRERVSAVRGQVTIDQTEGWFVIDVRLPLLERSEDA